MVRFLPFLISLVLTVYALFSCIQTRSEDVPHLPKLIWLALIVFVPFVGPITWLLMARSRGISGGRVVPGAKPKPPVRPVAPDDDPDFLASLERYRDPRTTPLPPDLRPKPADKGDDAERSGDQPKDAKGKRGRGSADGKAMRDPAKPDPAHRDAAHHESAHQDPAAGDRPKDGPGVNPANRKAVDGQETTGPEPEAAPDSSTEADGGEGTRKP